MAPGSAYFRSAAAGSATSLDLIRVPTLSNRTSAALPRALTRIQSVLESRQVTEAALRPHFGPKVQLRPPSAATSAVDFSDLPNGFCMLR